MAKNVVTYLDKDGKLKKIKYLGNLATVQDVVFDNHKFAKARPYSYQDPDIQAWFSDKLVRMLYSRSRAL